MRKARANVLASFESDALPRLRSFLDEASHRDLASLTVDDIAYVVSTGYGRVNVPFADCQVTELTCHARGIGHLFPGAQTAIDIGGQDAKGLKISSGRLVDFVMNDRCAAGTGRFLEMTATSASSSQK